MNCYMGKYTVVRSVTLVLMLLFASAAFAQAQRGARQPDRHADERMKAIESRRIAYLTSQMSLSSSEAAEFWPVYNEYNEEVENLSDGFRQKREELPEPENMNEEEAKLYLQYELERFEKSAALRREYTQKMLEVVSARQIAILFDAEREFNRILFREAQRRQRQDSRSGER